MNIATFYNLLSIIGVLFLLMVTGFICRRTGIIDNAASNRLSGLIIKIGQPMMIIGALISKDFSTELLKEGLFYLLIGLLLHPLMALFSLLCGRFFQDPEQKKLSQFALIFTNCGFVGFPVLEAVFPGKGAFNGAFFIIGFHIYIWTLGIYILSRGRDDIRLTPRKALINFGTVPCALGLLLYLAKAVIPMPAVAVDFCNYLGNLSMPISVLVTGALVATQDFRTILKSPRLYLFNAIKLLLLPLAVCFIAKACTLGMDNSYGIVLFCTVIAALPSAATVTMLAELYDINPGWAAQTVGSSSMLSVATLPLLYFIGDLVARL
ncbi:MAG: hypothetical protein E7663_00310 [Ruminococcaceae bacterium]|nr:hypothetical protein [Oscillospiraceae bacterium]